MTSRADTLRALLFASSAAGMLIATPTRAEEPGPDAPIATADAQDPTDLGTVNVNGQRVRREPQSPQFVAPLVDTPRAVTIIPQQIIEQTKKSGKKVSKKKLRRQLQKQIEEDMDEED